MEKQQCFLCIVDLYLTVSCIKAMSDRQQYFYGKLSPVKVNHIWPSYNLVDATQKQKYSFTRCLSADLQFVSAGSNDSLDVAQFLRFCKCCAELFYERRRIYSVMKK